MNKLKAKVMKNRKHKYEVHAELDREYLPIGETKGTYYKLLQWDTEEEAIEHILNDDRLEFVK